MSEKRNLPTVADLTKDTKIAKQTDEFNYLMNQEPPEKWIEEHPYIKGYRYLPIHVIEYLLKKIFKQYKIEVRDQGQIFNGMYVVVRVHYLHPVTNEWGWHDGIGAIEVQTEKGATPADMSKIKNGAIDKGFPAAKARAVKNACYGFGKFFGSDLNRENTLEFKPDANLAEKTELTDEDWEMLKEAVRLGKMNPHDAIDIYKMTPAQMVELQEIEVKPKDEG